jgi:hypothetical protein
MGLECGATLLGALTFFCAARGAAQSSPVVLDRVVAVVNRRVILASDLDEEIQLSILDPNQSAPSKLTRQIALEQLISRALIEQQIRQQDMQAVEPSADEVKARLEEIRTQLPACVRQNCASDAGWQVFLSTHELTASRIESYLRYRLEILRFIELRFRQGMQIPAEQVEKYYRETLVPQYAAGETVPPLAQVADRIQEILLQQQVNALFDDWLNNLRQQGDVEVLDPGLATAEVSAPEAATKRGGL